VKVLLVNPPRFKGMPVCRITRCENIIQESVFTPFDVLIIGSLLKLSGHEVYFVDANAEDLSYMDVEKKIVSFKPDVTVFHVSQECFMHDLQTGVIAKKHGSKTIAINWTFKTMAKEVYEDISDVVDCFAVNHNYIIGIVEKLSDLPSIMNYEPKMDFGSLPFPDWSLIKDFNLYYTRVKSIKPYCVTASSWGCPMGCLFCNYRKTDLSFRNPKRVAEEIFVLSKGYGVKYIHFYDATFNFSKSRVYDVCDEIERQDLEVKWFINARTDNWDLDLAKRCKEVGLDGVSFGIESFSQDILNLIDKKVTVEKNIQSILDTKKAGIKTNLSLMIGFPGETEEHYDELIRCLKLTKPNGFFISPYGMCALPNTHWFEKERQEGKDFGDWRDLHKWGNWHSFCSFSTLELQRTRKRIYREVVFSFPYLFSNLKWLLLNPSDFKMGIQFLLHSIYKHFKGWRYYR